MNNLSFDIALPAIGFVLGALAILFLSKRGGSISYKDVSLSFGQKVQTDGRIKRISEYMDERMITIRQILLTGYMRLLKEQGCPEDILSDNEDSKYVNQMLGNIVFSGNGIKSIKSIFEHCFLIGQFMKMNFPSVISFLMETAKTNMQIYISTNYRTTVRYTDNSTRTRLVSNTEWIASLPDIMMEVKPLVEDIIQYALSLYKDTK
jgi:hypothetical protein